jgi:hypothetical protein
MHIDTCGCRMVQYTCSHKSLWSVYIAASWPHHACMFLYDSKHHVPVRQSTRSDDLFFRQWISMGDDDVKIQRRKASAIEMSSALIGVRAWSLGQLRATCMHARLRKSYLIRALFRC